MRNGKITDAINMVYTALKAEKGSVNKVSDAFVATLNEFGVNGDNALFDDVRYGVTKQVSTGKERDIGVYINGNNMYDADFDGTSRIALVVDILLRNDDTGRYTRFADAMAAYLEGLPVGLARRVININFSQPTAENSLRLTLVFAVEFEPETDGGATNGISYV